MVGIYVIAPWFSTSTPQMPQPAVDSSALELIQQGQVAVQVIHDLIDAHHEIAKHSETIQRVRDLAPHLTLQANAPFSTELGVEKTRQDQRSMDQFLTTYDSVMGDLHSAINITVTEFGGAKGLFIDTICDACNRSSLHCTLLENRNYQLTLGKWSFQSSPEASPLSELTKSTAAINPKLSALKQSIRDLQGINSVDAEELIEIVKEGMGLQGDETLCREDVERLRLCFSHLAGAIAMADWQRLRLEHRISQLMNSVGWPRCLCPAPEDVVAVAMKLGMLRISSNKARERWELVR